MGARFRVLVSIAVSAICAMAIASCSPQPAQPSASSASVASSASTSSSASASSRSAASGGTATVDLDYSAGTGYEWVYAADPEGVVEFVGQSTENKAGEQDIAGGALQDHFTFAASSPGEVVITFDLVRSWEADEEPAETQVYAFTVTDDLELVLNPYKSDFENEPSIV